MPQLNRCDSQISGPFGSRAANGEDHRPAPYEEPRGKDVFSPFELSGGVYVVTGGARGIGLAIAEALAEAGGEVYCLDWADEPDEEYKKAKRELRSESGTGQLYYRHVDVTDTDLLENTIADIAAQKQRLDGVCAAAGVQHTSPAVDYDVRDAKRVLDVNFVGAMMTAQAAGKEMLRYRTQGTICIIGSMSGVIANKGLLTPVYNSSKAAVTQLARSLAMEWGPVQPDGSGGIRVNSLSPGHVMTPMCDKLFQEQPGAKEKWEAENMMGRLGEAHEFKGPALFLMSRASSFMTGSNLLVDGGHTAW